MIQSIKTPRLYQKTHRFGKYNKLQDTKTIKFIIFIYELITCILWELYLTVMQTQLSSFQWIFPSNPVAFRCVSLRYKDTLSTWDPAAIPGWDSGDNSYYPSCPPLWSLHSYPQLSSHPNSIHWRLWIQVQGPILCPHPFVSPDYSLSYCNFHTLHLWLPGEFTLGADRTP